MYVRHSAHINQPFERCAERMRSSPREWFPRLQEETATVGPVAALRKRVKVELGDPIAAGTTLTVPLTWKPTSAAKLFPALRGRLELVPVDPTQTRLTVSGTYAPPLGAVGVELDGAVMHRVAEATIRDLVESMAARLES